MDEGYGKFRRRLALVSSTDCYQYYTRNYTIKSIAGTWTTFCAFPQASNPSICQGCHLSCKSCNGPGEDECCSCRDGFELKEGKCLKHCPSG